MVISIQELRQYLSNVADNTQSFKSFLKNLKSSNIKIFKDNQGCEIIKVNEEVYLDFSSNVFDKFNAFDFSNIIFLQKVTINNKNNTTFIFRNTKLENGFILYDCKEITLFLNEENIFNGRISISSSEFKSININSDLKGGGEIIFRGCSFRDFNISGYKKINIDNELFLESCIFDGKANFTNFEFNNQISFKMSKFENNVYFNNSIFKDFADFHECEFKNNACFYGVTFEKTPNFSQALFKDNLNMVNTKMSFDFENAREIIKKTEKDFNSKIMDKKKPLDKFANDFRDSFRIFKNALSKEGNILDSSNYHKVELYCKEIELDSKPNKTLQDKIDKWQLWFYRKTSEHHTDLLKIIAWVIIAIGSFGFLFFLLKCFQDISIISQLNPYGIALSFVGVISLWISWSIGYIHRLSLFAGIGLIFTLWIACYKPILIFGAINLIDKTTRSGFENFLLVLYTIVMILLLFSLQKTARKNSIIPS
ncbi:pentapeptide repeat-containing protein [Helicobacter anseris]|uniref:pentapeptide repeat-containing protein n=1 Tax=Helicobacter anseris TaxID=375926 RepID=UPI001475AA3A|nr:pentapeptide repeat-containing protein [Helicobacter anseris]